MKLAGRLRALILLSFGACRDFDLEAAQCVEEGRCALEDAGGDEGTLDAGTLDAGTLDAGTLDAGTLDAGTLDAGTLDAGTLDAGTLDAGTVDAGTVDAGTVDGGTQGHPCDGGLVCDSGRCVDGRCCNSDCSGACDFCDLPGYEGECRVAPLGRTPSVACVGGYACNGDDAECSTTCSSDAGCVGARCGAGAVCIEKLVQLKDDFNAGGFDASTWVLPGPNCSVNNQQFHATTAPGGINFARVYSRRRYELIDSELRLELVNAGNQSLATLQALAGGCDFPTGARCLYLTVGNGQVNLQLGDGTTYTAPLGYFPLGTFRVLRMREQSGTLYLEARNADAGFQQLGSMPTPLAAAWRDMSIGLGAGTYGAEPTPSTVIWDNVNTP